MAHWGLPDQQDRLTQVHIQRRQVRVDWLQSYAAAYNWEGRGTRQEVTAVDVLTILGAIEEIRGQQ